jgi:Xaa-Pro aminopeptidase
VLVQSGAVWLFFPHGTGHLVGLGVRDAGGTSLPERRDAPKPYPSLRIVDRMLDFGGIRVEDNILITPDGHEVITGDVPLLG